jgi:dihydrofolate reductase
MSAMAKLVYSMITSLDGYIADETGDITWGAPDAEVGAFVNEMERGVGTVLYGRRMYETMVYWETFVGSDDDPIENEFADRWRRQEKIVFSTTLKEPSSARTRIEHSFIPDEVERLKQSAATDLSIAGPHLASQAIEARLVDEMHLYVAPVTLGGGTSAHPGDARTPLELLDVNRFKSGFVHLHYRLNG